MSLCTVLPLAAAAAAADTRMYTAVDVTDSHEFDPRPLRCPLISTGMGDCNQPPWPSQPPTLCAEKQTHTDKQR